MKKKLSKQRIEELDAELNQHVKMMTIAGRVIAIAAAEAARANARVEAGSEDVEVHISTVLGVAVKAVIDAVERL